MKKKDTAPAQGGIQKGQSHLIKITTARQYRAIYLDYGALMRRLHCANAVWHWQVTLKPLNRTWHRRIGYHSNTPPSAFIAVYYAIKIYAYNRIRCFHFTVSPNRLW